MVNLFFASVLIVLYSTHVGPLFTFTILFIISLICLFIYYGFRFLTPFTQIIGVCIMFTQVVSYFLTAIINPGIPKRDLFIMKGNKKLQTDELVGKMKWCEYCDIINKEESNTRHCYDCEICVEGNTTLIKGMIIIVHGHQNVLERGI